MAKYPHSEDTKIVLDDLANRVQQLIEINDLYSHGENEDKVKYQRRAFEATLTLIKQVKDNGHVMRGNDYFPDSIEPLVTTKWNKKPQLGV